MKKGAYDLGRKALYYVVAIMIISLIFVYMSNALYKYQNNGLENLDNLKGIATINKVNSCFYYEDKETGRVYLNTVDMEKFKQENLGKCTDMPVTVNLIKFNDKNIASSSIANIKKEAREVYMTLSQKQENIKDKRTMRRMVTIIDRGVEEEGLLVVETQK